MISFEPEGEFSSYTAEVASGNWLVEIRIRMQERFETHMRDFNNSSSFVCPAEDKEHDFPYVRKPNSNFFTAHRR